MSSGSYNYTVQELPISPEEIKKLKRSQMYIIWGVIIVCLSIMLYFLFGFLCFVTQHLIKDRQEIKWIVPFVFIGILLIGLWKLKMGDSLIASIKLTNKYQKVARLKLKGKVLQKRYNKDPEDDTSYFICIDNDLQLEVLEPEYNSCHEGQWIELTAIVLNYSQPYPFPAKGIIIESIREIPYSPKN